MTASFQTSLIIFAWISVRRPRMITRYCLLNLNSKHPSISTATSCRAYFPAQKASSSMNRCTVMRAHSHSLRGIFPMPSKQAQDQGLEASFLRLILFCLVGHNILFDDLPLWRYGRCWNRCNLRLVPLFSRLSAVIRLLDIVSVLNRMKICRRSMAARFATPYSNGLVASQTKRY